VRAGEIDVNHSADRSQHPDATIDAIASAVLSRQPLPPMSCSSVDDGYRVQRALSAHINADRGGDLKAGVTATAAQQQLGLEGPLAASLYIDGRLENGCKLSVTEGQELECEIAVITDGSGKPLGLMPAVEVVYLAFSRAEDLSIANAVAANLGADRYICGEVVRWDESTTQVPISVCKDGVEIATMTNNYSFGSPASGAAWLVDEGKKHGLWRDSEQRRVLLLGTCGNPIPAQPGQYRIDFGPLGTVDFSLVQSRLETSE
jgi:2-keto-4-pentenoate hydratase